MAFSRDTIAARATPPGEGGIAIIRISGSGAFPLVQKCFHSSRDPLENHNQLIFGQFIDPADGSLIDQALCVVFPQPHSYTGEDVAEIHCHGSPAVITRGLDILCSQGARMAEPGEFTKRAFLNGNMDLTRAEAVCDLIRSRTEKSARLALRQLGGGLYKKIQNVKQNILTVAAEIEARLDFPEEELGQRDDAVILKTIDEILQQLRLLIQNGRRARIFRLGARVVIVGKPNTGKSSLFNALIRMERAIVTPHPGTTRDFIEGTVDLEGCPVSYVDTAGLHQTRDEVEILGIRRAMDELTQADLILFLLDSATPIDQKDFHILEHIREAPYFLVLNKNDLPNRQRPEYLAPFEEKAKQVVRLSALTGENVKTLESGVVKFLLSGITLSEDTLTVSERHTQLLRKAARALETAQKGFISGIHEELLMIDIREGLQNLARITGEESDDELLDVVFSRFCIGK